MRTCKTLLLMSILILFIIALSFAGTTGKIAGTVVDAKTGEAMPGANVILDGTMMGAATDLSGRYVIINVPPGTYKLRASIIGYKIMAVENVRVSLDLTTTINFQMEETVLDVGEEITIVATRPMVIKDLTATTAVMDSKDIQALPITEVQDAIQLQAGLVKDAGGGLHIRGGRSGEISYWIDGIPVTDVYDGGSVVEVNKNMVQELQVVSGAFNAEYGQAMSGIVNIATKDGSNKYGGSVSTYFGDHLSGHDDIFMHIKDFNPVAIRNFEGSFEGALLKDKLFFFLNGRHIYSDGYLYGQRRYTPQSVTTTLTVPSDILKEIAPDYYRDSKSAGGNQRTFQYIYGTNALIDSQIVRQNLAAELAANPDSFSHYYQMYRNNHKNSRGDNKYVSMDWNRKNYLQGKLVYRFTPSIKLAYSYIYDDVDYQEWSGFDHERDYKYNPDGAPNKFSQGNSHILQLTQAINEKTFYKVGFSFFTKSFKKYLYEDPHDPGYVHPDLASQDPFSYKTAGTAGTATDNGLFNRETRTLLGKFDLTSQMTNTHQIKLGLEFRKHRVFFEDMTLRPVTEQSSFDAVFGNPFVDTEILPTNTIYHSRYLHRPVEFSGYIQDKMEFKNMIVNLGVRFDYFAPDGVMLNDETDPTIANPIRPENRYRDWGSDGLPNTYDADGTEDNGIQDANEPVVTLEDRQAYWYKDASAKFKVSPRLGISFPITDQGVIYFSYGHFFQIPRFERLYQNPDFELGSGTGNVGVIGNADLEPEQTVSGEIGLQQQLTADLSLNVTGYFRDIRNLAGTQAQEIVIYGGSAKYSKIANGDFGFIKGIILALNKRYSGGLSSSLDYTFQLAKGSNSDPEQARKAISGGALPEVQLTALDWDQKHTVNAAINYQSRTWGGSLIGRWGSGLPYSPRATVDITSLLTNSQRRPTNYNVDIRAFKTFQFGPGALTAFVRVFNLFDTLNEINVYDDSGRADTTIDETNARASKQTEVINSLDDWFTNPTFYSEPRRVEVGVSYDF